MQPMRPVPAGRESVVERFVRRVVRVYEGIERECPGIMAQLPLTGPELA